MQRDPGGCERSLVLVFFLDLNLVISKKSIHEGKGLMSSTCIDNLIDEGCGEFVFGTCPIEIAEFVQTQIVPCFLFTGTGLETQVV